MKLIFLFEVEKKIQNALQETFSIFIFIDHAIKKLSYLVYLIVTAFHQIQKQLCVLHFCLSATPNIFLFFLSFLLNSLMHVCTF